MHTADERPSRARISAPWASPPTCVCSTEEANHEPPQHPPNPGDDPADGSHAPHPQAIADRHQPRHRQARQLPRRARDPRGAGSRRDAQPGRATRRDRPPRPPTPPTPNPATSRAEPAPREAQEAEETHSQAEPREETDPGAPTIHLAPRHHPITPPAAPAEPPRAEPDDDLTLMLRAALTRYTLGTVLDEAWAVEAKLFGTLATPRETRTRKARTA